MNSKTNKALIGAFVVGSIALLVIAILFFGSGKLFKHTTTFVMFFEKSISGLSTGSPVVFMGVPVGRVIDIKVDSKPNELGFIIPVYIELYEDTHTIFIKNHMSYMEETEYLDNLVHQGLRASLAPQSLLTGQLMIELSFIPKAFRGEDFTQVEYYHDIPIIPTTPSRLDNIWNELTSLPLDKISANILKITKNIENLTNTPDTPNLIPTMCMFLQQGTITVKELSKSIATLQKASKKYGKMLDSTNTQVNNTLKEASKSFQIINENIVLELHQAIQEFSKAAKAIRILATTIERNPESLIRGKNTNQP